ncbi:MAG: PKD domain-containing protein, partial [Flavobacteriales bacterium]
MKTNKRNIAPLFLILIFLIVPLLAKSQSGSTRFLFKENKGQCNERVTFKSKIPDGNLFLTKKGITYSFFDKSAVNFGDSEKDNYSAIVKCHAVQMEFENANANYTISKSRKSNHYENYFKGNNKANWATEVYTYNEVIYENIYSNIDFKIYEYAYAIKYDFVVSPGANPSQIRFNYQGQDELVIEDGALVVKTSVQDIIEQKPYAYQFIEGKKTEVKCEFVIENNTVHFSFPDEYNENYELVIDPIIVFSSYVNSTSDNFGFAATYDTSEHSYVSGIVFGAGYPTSVGAYDVTWAGGSTFPFYADIAISKFTPEGDSLLYSTYLGGTDGEVPHSMVTNDQGELYVYGTTGSANFPVLGNSYDNTFNGGSVVTPNSKSTSFSVGTDIFLVKFNTTGTALLGSTFIGGSANDGINIALGLAYNHGDEYRGDIVLDNVGNPYVVSTTNSTNFPIVNGTASLGGVSDAVVFKFNNNLSTLLWSTYYGGTGNDAGHGIARDATGNIFITGGTSSASIGSALSTNTGGIDGYLTKFNAAGVLQTARFVGTNSFDQSYFVDVDVNDEVYIMGQSLGIMPVFSSGPVYSNAGSHQFIQKYNNTLTTLEMATKVGKNGTSIDFSPTAFKVSACGMIYLSGWGGVMNLRAGGSTNGLPIYRPHQGGSTGSDFYMMLLEPDAKALFNATFFGGSSGAEHVDGGNSKFDDKGNIYQAVCAGCNSTNDYPTTQGVWSDTNGYSNNCNAALFKFKIDTIFSNPTIPSVAICFPNTANFGNLSVGANAYLWDFGDTNTSTAITPSHNYLDTGRYKVTLIAYDSNGCLEPDTNELFVHVLGPPVVTTSPDRTRCPNQPTTLFASGASSYSWSPGATLSSTVGSTTVATTNATTTYTVIGTGLCGADTGYITITINAIPPVLVTSGNRTICPGDSVIVFGYAIGNPSYSWSPSAAFSDPNISNPKVAPRVTTTYTVIANNNCGS